MVKRLKYWWQRVVGRLDPVDSRYSTQRAATPGELTIADDTPTKPKARSGKAGFDPYSSDAGYSKPHGWERVDHD